MKRRVVLALDVEDTTWPQLADRSGRRLKLAELFAAACLNLVDDEQEIGHVYVAQVVVDGGDYAHVLDPAYTDSNS